MIPVADRDRLRIPTNWHESYSYIVLACSGCNGSTRGFDTPRRIASDWLAPPWFGHRGGEPNAARGHRASLTQAVWVRVESLGSTLLPMTACSRNMAIICWLRCPSPKGALTPYPVSSRSHRSRCYVRTADLKSSTSYDLPVLELSTGRRLSAMPSQVSGVEPNARDRRMDISTDTPAFPLQQIRQRFGESLPILELPALPSNPTAQGIRTLRSRPDGEDCAYPLMSPLQ